jgi:CBS domain-containing protein
MSEGGYRHLPIANAKGEITGIISTRNLISLLTGSVLDELSQAMH